MIERAQLYLKYSANPAKKIGILLTTDNFEISTYDTYILQNLYHNDKTRDQVSFQNAVINLFFNFLI